MLGAGPRLPALPHKQGRTQAGSEGGREAAGRQEGEQVSQEVQTQRASCLLFSGPGEPPPPQG